MTTTIQTTMTYTIITCSAEGCGVTFALDDEFIRARRQDHATWYCPNGHRRYYPDKSDLEKAQDEVERAKRRAAWLTSEVDQERARADHNERRANGYKGAMVAAKKRATKGVCPVPGCRRHFVDVQRHIESKHPDYASEDR